MEIITLTSQNKEKIKDSGDRKNYIEVSKASDLKEKKERIIYRFFEILPGFFSWTILISSIVLSYFKPVIVGIFIIAFDFYWFLKVVALSIYQLSAFFKMKKNLQINWLSLAKENKEFGKIFHLVCLPFYKEEKETIEDSLQAILNSNYPKEKIIIVLAVEEAGGKKAKKIAREIEKKFKDKFYKFFLFFHPQHLPNEIPGKGSNVNFAIENVKEKILKEIPPENIIFSIFDIDTKPYPNYFAILTYQYLKLKMPQHVCFQPIPVYHNNIWEVPFFSRIIATSNTFWQMMQQERPEQLVSYSSHSLPFTLVLKLGYPKNVISDDSRIFWKSYFLYDGNFKTIPLFYPVSMDAVLGKNLWRTIINQYKQQRRWAFGAENIPYIMFGFLKNKKIPLSQKIFHTMVMFEGFISWAVASLLIFLLGWLPLVLGGEDFKGTIFGYNLPIITRNLMIIASVGMVLSAILSILLLPKSPSKFGALKKLSIFFQWIFLPPLLILFGAFPALDAQTRLLFGKYLDFWTTEKFKK